MDIFRSDNATEAKQQAWKRGTAVPKKREVQTTKKNWGAVEWQQSPYACSGIFNTLMYGIEYWSPTIITSPLSSSVPGNGQMGVG